MRRSLLDEGLVLCQDLTSGTTSSVYFADDSVMDPDCVYSNKANAYSSWSTHRADLGGTALGYIYSRDQQLGEFFNWDNEVDNLSQMYLERPSGTWTNSYSSLLTTAYVIEEWEFSLSGDTLQMVIDGDSANAINVVNGLTDFQVTVELADATVVEDFNTGSDWSNVALVNITLDGSEQAGQQTIARSVTGSFFPRNVLSN